jgi:4-amino-4-deoxy-L-arabinose transferase-like glycosyltransferase
MGYRITFAVALVLIGFVLLLQRAEPEFDLTGLFQRYWPAIFVLVGLVSLANLHTRTKAARVALLLVLAGGFLTLLTADLLPNQLRPYGLPVALVAAGTAVLIQQARRGERRPEKLVDRFFFIGHTRQVNRTLSTPSLLVLFALVGGCELYFEDSVGTPARVDITAGLSGIDIVVPKGWTVYVEPPAIGRQPVNHAPAADSPDEANLRVHALCLLSGVVIRSV